MTIYYLKWVPRLGTTRTIKRTTDKDDPNGNKIYLECDNLNNQRTPAEKSEGYYVVVEVGKNDN